MLLFKKKRKTKVGMRPGALAESDDAEPTMVRMVRYAPEVLFDEPLVLEQPLPKPGESEHLWLDVRGLKDLSILKQIGRSYGVHALALEDVVNVPQRPKAEIYERDTEREHYFVIFRVVGLDPSGELSVEQVSLVLSKSFLLSFQETQADALEPVRERLQAKRARMRRLGPDYLAYAMIDTVIDGYYPVLERIAEQLEELEDSIMLGPTPVLLRRLQRHKRTLLLLRRAVWPERDALAYLLREPSQLVQAETKVYLRDVYDHTVQIVDVIESYRDLVGELTNTYLSVASNRMNEVMKMLTIMSSIFIPLTFLAGIYGMNFDVLPELRIKWAYPVLLGVMALIAVGMLVFFWRRGWLGGAGHED